jgi:hypothetical protein
MIDRLDSDYPAYEAMEHDKKQLHLRIDELLRQLTATEARLNLLARDNAQLIWQHQQDAADIKSARFENMRLNNRATILEGALQRAAQRTHHD